MSPFMHAMAARPQQFRRERSVGATVGGAAIAIACVIGIILVVANWAAWAEFLNSGTPGVRTLRAGNGPIAVAATVPVLVIGAIVAARWSIRRNGRWTRLLTGSTVRRIETLGYRGDGSVVDDLHRRLESGDPAVFLPLPRRHGRSSLFVDLWAADADRTAFAIVVPNTKHELMAQRPIIELSGEAYDALVAAAASGTLEAAEGTTPLDAPAAAAAAAPAAPGSPPAPTRSEPVRFWYDLDFARRLLGRNSHRTVIGWIMTGAGLVLVGFGIGVASLFTVIVGGIVAICAAIAVGIARLGQQNARWAFGRMTGDYLLVDDETISFEALPRLPWSEVTAVSIWDRREQIGASYAIPSSNWAEDGATAYGQSSGVGQTTISFVVRDGVAARGRLVDPRQKSFVALGRRRPGHARPGQILITPDTALPFDSVLALVDLIRRRSESYGFPVSVSTRGSDYLEPIERAMDPARSS